MQDLTKLLRTDARFLLVIFGLSWLVLDGAISPYAGPIDQYELVGGLLVFAIILLVYYYILRGHRWAVYLNILLLILGVAVIAVEPYLPADLQTPYDLGPWYILITVLLSLVELYLCLRVLEQIRRSKDTT